MKWKDWFVSTLPRSKKSRRKSTPSSSSKHSDPHSGSLSSPETDDIITRNQRLHADVINGNKKKKRPTSSASCNNRKYSDKLTEIAYNRQLVSPDFHYVGDQTYTNPCGYNTLTKTSSNASESGFEDGYDPYGHCYQSGDLKWCCGVASAAECENTQPDLLPSLNHTFPRQRTRIKTNPWVSGYSGNSMTTSYNSDAMTSSMHSDIMTSSMTSDNSSRSPVSGMSTPPMFRDCENNALPPPLTPNRNWNNGNYRSTTDSEDASDSDWFGQGRSYSYESNANEPVFSAEENDDPGRDDFLSGESGILTGGNLVINLNTGNVFVKQAKPVFSTVSFQYEDDLDATLEKELSNKKRRSRKVPCGEDNDDTPHCSDREHEFSQDGTLTRSGTTGRTADLSSSDAINVKSFRKHGHRKHEVYERSTNDSLKLVFYESLNKTERKETDCQGNSDIMYESVYQREGTDSAYDSSTLSSLAGSSFHGPLTSLERQLEDNRPMTLPSLRSLQAARGKQQSDGSTESRRSLEQIHCSLKEKVERLRAEKRIVDEKVKQAMEEEEIKKEEKARIQKEVSSLRKQVLLRTLQELKENLESQSARLQEAYDDVLDMQWLNAKMRRMRNTTI